MRGKQFVSSLKSIRMIQDAISLINYKIEQEPNLKRWHFYIGQLEAYNELSNKSIRSILNEIRSTNEELGELNFNKDLYEMHIQQLEGYKYGCKKIIDFHKVHGDKSKDIKILVYVQDEALKDLLIILFDAVHITQDITLEKNPSVCVSTDIALLNELSESVECFKFVLAVKPYTKKAIKVDKRDEKNIKVLKNDIANRFNLLHSRSKEDNFFLELKMLNQEWLQASYVYIQGIINIEQVFSQMIKSIRV